MYISKTKDDISKGKTTMNLFLKKNNKEQYYNIFTLKALKISQV